MQPNKVRHQDMIPLVAGNGGLTGQMVGRKAWQHEANVAIANVRLLRDAGVKPERTMGFGQVIVAARRLSSAFGGALVRLGGRLQGGAPGVPPVTDPASPIVPPVQGEPHLGAAPSNRRFRMYMHTTPPVRAHSPV